MPAANYFKVSIRQLLRHKIFSLINIFSVGTGVACSILLFMLVWHEITYDRFHDDYERIYRVGLEGKFFWGNDPQYSLPASLGPALGQQLPEVVEYARIAAWGRNHLVVSGRNNFLTTNAIYADDNFFRFFGFDLIGGDPSQVLNKPFTTVITGNIAVRLFGRSNPIGETIKVDNTSYTITGIAEEPPKNSHITYSVILSLQSLYSGPARQNLESWNNFNSSLYVKLAQEAGVTEFTRKAGDILDMNMDTDLLEKYGISITPFTRRIDRVHLEEAPEGGFKPNVNRPGLYILGGVSVLILVVGCLNYVIHSTARAAARAREVGLRKVAGAGRKNLVFQFLGESFMVTFWAFILAILLAEICLPVVNRIFNTDMVILSRQNSLILLTLPLLFVVVGLMSGFYPSLYLSAISPARIIRNGNFSISGKSFMRQTLVIFQIVVASALLVCSMIMNRQINYIGQKDLGFEASGRIVIPLNSAQIRNRHLLLKEHMAGLQGVKGVAASDKYPGIPFSSSPHRIGGLDESVVIARHVVDHDYIGVMGINIVKGRAFSREYPGDIRAAMVNETAAKTFGWDDPIGKTVAWGRSAEAPPEVYNVIGVVSDYHYKSLHEPVEPLVLFQLSYEPDFLTIALDQDNIAKAIGNIRDAWNELFRDEVFTWIPLEGAFSQYYEDEMKMGGVINFFTMLVVVISSLGLFALASFITANRTREIAVRKVFGSTARGISLLFVKQFAIWVIVSNLAAWPVAWFLMQRWLRNFAYQTESTDPVIYLSAFLITLAIALSVTAWQTIKTALINPAQTLKYE